MNSLWPSRAPTDASITSTNRPPQSDDVADTGIPSDDTSRSKTPLPSGSQRPGLQRSHMSVPPPPPAAPAPPQNQQTLSSTPQNGQQQQQQQQQMQQQQPPDSLSLAQLRRIVAEFPHKEPIAYDYVYTDMAPIEEEIDEWFVYNFWQWVRLNTAQRNFYHEWAGVFPDERPWKETEERDRRAFVKTLLADVASPDASRRSGVIGALMYLVLGRWMESVEEPVLPSLNDTKVKSAATPSQLTAMKAGVELLAECGGIPVVWDAFRKGFEPFWNDDVQQAQAANLQGPQDELMNLMTIMYMAIQETLSDPFGLPSVRSELLALEPGLLEFLIHVMAKLRWDEAGMLPHTQIFLLFWKCILLVFGGSEDLARAKKATAENKHDTKEMDSIVASPLDYNVFRQEVISKYPAYVPPQLELPLEPEQTTLLPQPSSHPKRNDGSNGIIPAQPIPSGAASILHQPVHIATPAPSPPPSPGVGGKGGKKQNYQTNQNFPFMYPPLDATSNGAGGAGASGLQDLLVGRRWEGSDVPASILEAGELFSQRVRMTRATRQLWDERERFLKYERGYEAEDDDVTEHLDLSSLTLEEKEVLGLNKQKRRDEDIEPKVDLGPRGTKVDPRTRRRLEAVEKFYAEALPHLQSLVVVLLKTIATIASNLMVQPNGQQPGGPGQHNGVPGAGRKDGHHGQATGLNELLSPSDEQIDATRSREISAKAVTGSLLMLLKWLKLSHILKFEYLTQLLLDANYIPLVLKLFALHEVQQVVESKTDRMEHSFFYFCNIRAGANPNPAAFTTFEEDMESEDDAAPPPIKMRRSSDPLSAGCDSAGDTYQGDPDQLSASGDPPASGEAATRPEVDELGYPVNPLPKEPITDFSRRNFFTLINYLRIMQKICKHKAHRNLLLVHYKSSNILRKSLKVPQPELRLYTLKLFKNQVPYCGRKWRQSNMRVITAVYLHCRPELRDEWLAGSDVDNEVDQALPLEQALRSLTHWFNVRRYPDKMAPEVRQALREEQDFFVRELEKLDLTSWVGDGMEDEVAEWEGDIL